LGAYVLAALVYVISSFAVTNPPSPNLTGFILLIILIIGGIFFGFRSIVKKESGWAGYLTAFLGIFILVAPFIINIYVLDAILYKLGIIH